MLAVNILVARLAAGWLPPLALTFWRWFFTALLAGALAAGAVRASWPAMKREAPASFLLEIGRASCRERDEMSVLGGGRRKKRGYKVHTQRLEERRPDVEARGA